MSIDGYADTPEVLETMNALSAQLADRELLTTYDRGIIRDLGLRYRGRGRWPMFRSIKPGYVPWRPEADEAEFLTLALRAMVEVAARVKAGELTLYREDAPTLFWPGRCATANGWTVGKSSRRLSPPRLIPIGSGCNSWPSPTQSRQFPGVRHLLSLLTGPAGARSTAFLPNSCRNRRRGFRYGIPAEPLRSQPPENDRQELLVKLLESLPFLPAEIVVARPQIAQLVAPVTGPLDIQLAMDETPAIWSFQEDMAEFFDG